ncbi:MAG: hypothetical protein ABFR31_06640 [Thermodesulfobacteriota bacterium]
MKKKVFLSVFLLFSFLLSGTGTAFVPQAPHLLHLVIQKVKRPTGFEVFQTKKFFNYENSEDIYVELEEKLSYLNPNKLRSQILSGTTKNFYVESNFKFIKISDGAVVSRYKLLVEKYTDILIYRNYETLLTQLALSGIDTSKVSFQRYDDKICYVIGGSKEKGKKFSGLWVEKDTFLPVKYVVEKNNQKVEFLYYNWQKFSRTMYPMQIYIYLNDKFFAMVNVKTFDLRSNFSPALFNIGHIESMYPKKKPVNELNNHVKEQQKLYE